MKNGSLVEYCSDTYFFYQKVRVNSVDQVQTAPEGAITQAVWSESTLFSPFCLHLFDALLYGKTTLFKSEDNKIIFSAVPLYVFLWKMLKYAYLATKGGQRAGFLPQRVNSEGFRKQHKCAC